MPAWLRLVLIAALAWCAVGLGEASSAHPADGVAIAAAVDDGDRSNDMGGEMGAAHHHCPVAPDMPDAAHAMPAIPVAMPACAAPANPLASRKQAPALEPPTPA